MENQNKISFFNKIQVKISVLIMLITTIILGCFAVYQYVSVKSKMNTDLIEFSEITSKRLSTYLAGPMWAVEESGVENLVVSEMLEKRITAIIVKEADRETVVVSKKRDKKGNIVDSESVAGSYIVKSGDILSQHEGQAGKLLGVVDVYVTSEFMKLELRKTIMDVVVALIILNIIIMIGIFAIVKTILLKPITSLTDVAERTSVGDMDVEIDISSNDEIGALANAIDRMQSSLKISLKKLKRK